MDYATQVAQGDGESYFDGGVFQRLGWKILGYLVTGLTLGICYPFAVNWMYSWEARHTVIGGRRLKFTGSAGGLFGTWMLCLLLCLVTLGIYYFWVPLKIRKWREANTFFEDEIPTFDAEQRLRREKASRFDGGLMQYIGWNILGWLVTFFTLGICYPWAVQMVYSWEQRHKVYCGRRCTFDGRAVGLFGTWMLCLLLCLVTFGIYSFWVPLRVHRWKVKHTHLLADDTPAEETESKELTPEELAEKKRRKEKLAALLSVAGPVLTVAGTVMQILFFKSEYMRHSWSDIFRYYWYMYWPLCLLLCAVGLLALSRVKIKNRSVVQLGLITAALLFASLVVSIVGNSINNRNNRLVGTVGTLLSLAGVAVSFAGWYKGLATEELMERQRKERAAARLSVAGSVLTVVGTVRLICLLKLYSSYSWSNFFQYDWPLCLLLLCAVGLLVLSRVKIKNRSVVQLILMIAAPLFLLLSLQDNGRMNYGWLLQSLLQSFAYYLREDAFLRNVVRLLDILLWLLPYAGVGVSFAGWLKERRAAAEVAEDAADE